MKQFGLIGFPLDHSFSKKYFTEKFAKENIDAAFENYSLETLDVLPSIVKEQQLEGFAITIPHKKNIFPYLYWSSETVKQMNACNCVCIKEGKWYGHNTDALGFENSLIPFLQAYHTKALVLGTGGAAAAIQFVLKKLGILYKNVSRTKKEETFLYEELSAEIINEYKLIINCTPMGTYPKVDNAPSIPYEYLTASHYLYDLVYNPSETLFLKKGMEKGATVKNGYEMLVLQAEENWKLWNSKD